MLARSRITSSRIAFQACSIPYLPARNLSATPSRFQEQVRPSNPHTSFYRTHGRALFKSLTLAFFSYQVFYWAWLTLEAEQLRDEKESTIHSLKAEVQMLSSGKGTHVLDGEKRLLDEQKDKE